MEPRVTIITACRNEARHIRVFLDGLRRQTGVDWEAILADGRSDDSTRDIIDEYCAADPRIRWIDNPGRIVSTGLNAAICQARGEIIIRMDAHTEYAPDYAAECVAALERTGADSVGGPANVRSAGYWGRAIAAAFHCRFANGGAKFHDPSFEGWVDTVPYGCWRKDTLERLGLFDETLVRNQDDELNLRLTREGGKIFQSARIKSWYHPRAKLSGLYRQHFQYGFWKVAVIQKHRVPASFRHLVPGAFVATHLILALLVAVAAAAGSPMAALPAALWAGVTAVYLLAGIVAAAGVGLRFGLDLVPALPLVFATYHISYGCGFLAGLYHFGRSREHGPAGKAFVGLSR